MTNPDPDPTGAPRRSPAADFSASGDVQPGETPPAEDQVSAPQGHEEHGPARAVPWVWIAVIGGVALVTALFFVGYAVGLLD
ncbi:DUF6480 family protein [Cellulosimicrobium marinum]|uniref:DUF6480 family protein n=1 Tax=Cellulosimicrobium marinum TaxID=1638992 RepID=UPI001E5469D6|nr:DUF6480 family protein [Cellulosimicrobium marinum]MCB7137484.1 DUF6480 family protein [Cellulosimicrobium marinum]